ncbi:MAG: hypothetical protein ACMV1B_05225, partial [Prevotella sp.]
MPIQGEVTLLEQVRNVVTTYKGTVGDGMSLADITKIARVEPITLISSSLTGTKDLYNILHGVLNIYTGYYLQAVNILATQIYDARILKILDKTNPDRDLKTFLTTGNLAFESVPVSYAAIQTLALENAKFKLPMLKSNQKAALESMQLDDFGVSDDNSHQREDFMASELKIDSFDKLGLTVGKVVQVSFAGQTPNVNNPANNGRNGPGNKSPVTTAQVPVIVKLDTMVTSSEVITSIATASADEITIGSRFKDAIGGRISFIKDFLLCSDLIRAQKKTMIKDVNGFYSQLLKRVNNSKLYSALSGNIS